MQISRYTFVIISLMLLWTGCGGNDEVEVHSALEDMQKNKRVRIVTDAVNTPFEFGSGTSVQGLDADLGMEIANDLGFEPKWVISSDTSIYSSYCGLARRRC